MLAVKNRRPIWASHHFPRRRRFVRRHPLMLGVAVSLALWAGIAWLAGWL